MGGFQKLSGGVGSVSQVGKFMSAWKLEVMLEPQMRWPTH